MLSVVVSFITAFFATLFIVKLSRNMKKMLDHDLAGVQKIHARPVPRIGGLAIYAATFTGTAVTFWRTPEVGAWVFLLVLCASLAFGCGIVEDFTKQVSAMRRLLLTMISVVIGYYVMDAKIVRIDIPLVDAWLKYAWIALPLTVLAVAGIANAINIIDGFNGLASVVSIFMLLSMAYVAFLVGDFHVMAACLILIGAIAGFFVWNYPNGLIFLGDGGAYFIGFMLGELAVLLVVRNKDVSAWYAVLLMIYPVFETIFSIYRRKFIRGVSPGLPDGIHLHMLVFKRLVRWTIGKRDAHALTRRNSLTAPYLWLLSLTAVIPATLFWRYQWVLVAFSLLFVITYVWLYTQIVRFKSPQWMILRQRLRKKK
jgi:UDP-N-acetylmuramyl pentapeptide phosphotransferase/UDP-N-acetylglucosamine-1-phosphate transferase